MGWINLQERERLRKKFKIIGEFEYWCDECDKPIGTGQLVFVDKKKGYLKDKSIPRGCRSFLTYLRPKVTYHWNPCQYKRMGKKVPDLKKLEKEAEIPQRIRKIMKKVFKMIKRKPRTQMVITSRFPNKQGELVRKAIKYLKKQEKIRKKKGKYILNS